MTDDVLEHYYLGIRDLSAENHWRAVSEDFSLSDKKTILILPGSATNSAQEANGMCKIVENMLTSEERERHTICSMYYPNSRIGGGITTIRVQILFDKYIVPLIAERNEKGDLEKINPQKAAQNLRNLQIVTHCYGCDIVMALDTELAKTLRNVGYSEEEQKVIGRQLFVVHHNNINENLGNTEQIATHLVRMTKADEETVPNAFTEDSFLYYVQKMNLTQNKALYIKISPNERVLLVDCIHPEGREHNGGYWSDDKRTAAGHDENIIFSRIFQEVTSTDYPLENMEQIIRNVIRKNATEKELFSKVLTYGKKAGDEFAAYRQKLRGEFAAARDNLQKGKLSKKQIEETAPSTLFLYDEKDGKTLLDMALEQQKVPTVKALWERIHKLLPKSNSEYNNPYFEYSSNYSRMHVRQRQYLQNAMNSNDEKLIKIFAKGFDDWSKLDYTKMGDKCLPVIIDAYMKYAENPANASMFVKINYYKSLIYLISRAEKAESTPQIDTVKNQTIAKLFDKKAVIAPSMQHKIKSFCSQFQARELLEKCINRWPVNEMPEHVNRDVTTRR